MVAEWISIPSLLSMCIFFMMSLAEIRESEATFLQQVLCIIVRAS